MKKEIIISAILLLVMTGCGGNRQFGNENDTFITVDIRASYPQKELILQDFMDVEYIALETSDEFLCQGIVLDIGKDIILVKNNIFDGDIFIFTRNGKGLRKINRKGQSGEEYINIQGITLDEDVGEMFVNDNFAKKIMVYDLYGRFQRRMQNDGEFVYNNICSFDSINLIGDDMPIRIGPDGGGFGNSPFVVISKQDGRIVHNIQIPFERKKSPLVIQRDGNNTRISFHPHISIIPYRDTWILTATSSDTVFRFFPDFSMIPFIVRTPSIQSMDPEVFLFPKMLTDRYYFMETLKNENEFPKTDLMYDRQERAIYEYSLYNDDYSSKQRVKTSWGAKNDGSIYWQKIEAYELVESYKKGELKGRLKEIAAGLDEEDNPVIMLVKNRN